MEQNARIYVAGHAGLVGSAICRELVRLGYRQILTRTHAELDLTNQFAVEAFFRDNRPEYVFLAAAMAGGIRRNSAFPAEMIFANLAIQTNVIDAARRHGVRKLLFIGSACSYPRECTQPIAPSAMLTGPIEPTNEPFAVAKIAGVRFCQACNRQYGTTFLSVIPATMYGPGDHFDENGHVAAALLARFHAAKRDGIGEVAVWGTGRQRREFMYVDDAAEGLAFLMDRLDDGELVNLGVGADTSIADLAQAIACTVGYEGKIVFDATRPDGMPVRLLDSSQIRKMGWAPRTSLAEGLAKTYEWYLEHSVKERR